MKTLTTYFVLLAFATPALLSAQVHLPPSLCYSLPGTVTGYCIRADASNSSYVAGVFQHTVDFDPSSATTNLSAKGISDIFIAKYNSPGSYEWAFSLGDSISESFSEISLDSQGNLYVVGGFAGTIDFDPSAGTANLIANTASSTQYVGFVAKYNTTGAYQWAFMLGNGLDARVRSIVNDGSGNCYITGFFTGTVDFDPSAATANLSTSGNAGGFIAKYNSSGNYQWAQNIVPSSKVRCDAAGNVYATGTFTGTVNLDPAASSAGVISSGNSFVVKYSSTGAYQWAFGIGGPSASDNISCLSVTGSGDCFVGGYVQGNMDMDPSANTAVIASKSHTSVEMFVAKYNTYGAYQWAFPITGDTLPYHTNTLSSICADTQGNCYITGYIRGVTDFEPSAGVYTLTNQLPNGLLGLGLFVARYSPANALSMAFTEGSGNAADICPDASSGFLITGRFSLLNNAPTNTQYAARYAGCLYVGINAASAASAAFQVYPNPGNGLFSIDTGYNGVFSLSVLNSLGQEVIKQQLSGNQNAIDLSAQPAGLYFVQLTQQDLTKSIRLIKN